ncbi:Uncharacterised protein [Serratia fonticola]|jgi:hypothetical protein|uniref:Uncharacterized protein n=1 Tax=Serratia fonticola TaxID=47917 RepID=A0A448SER3_SERFO|nr:Uncharacterised protein [Serratia fonticola]CAI0773901.1 Uncharacterised protein [Serratia fonticola]CAI1521768.1 Uncharacterised protein [Serratia fonticola]CAI1533459.1 Uncharacterised protein [Serratia fonticola]CAI1737334.1 Uncharacterised protein [Serratia fonticola]
MFSKIMFILFSATVVLVLINWERLWDYIRPMV